MTELGNAVLEEIDAERALDEIRSAATAPAPGPEPVSDPESWLLAHGRDGITWGVLAADGWHFSPEAASLHRDTLQQLRIFDSRREVLVWRTPDGLRGRSLADAPDAPGPPESWSPMRLTDPGRAQWTDPVEGSPTAPIDERMVILGPQDDQSPTEAFTELAASTGAVHHVPLPAGRGVPALHLRHYLELDDASGIVRIAATRLVALGLADRGEGRA